MRASTDLRPSDLLPAINRMWELSAAKIRDLEEGEHAWDPRAGAPVFTKQGRYTAQGWTEWTQGFQFGAAILQFDATGERAFLELGRERTRAFMAPHVSHVGVHDHGFNNVSTYGNLRRLALEGRFDCPPGELAFYELALKTSGAVQAARWSRTHDGRGYIYSFNGPHSLFSDTIRSLRSLALAHQLGHVLSGENDARVSLLGRLVEHALVTAEHNVYFGNGRDRYDVRGRVAHESIFNTNDGRYRCASTQQGYSPFTTWTRGLAWILLGMAEQLEFLATRGGDELPDREAAQSRFLWTAQAVADYYVDGATAADGIPYWDTGAPGLVELGDWRSKPADPWNDHEPVDSSAAAIAAQGLLRLGRVLHPRSFFADRYTQAGLAVARTLLDEPYLSKSPTHQGLLLHAVYHRPNGWDHVPEGRKIPCGESAMWGDYHLRELVLTIGRLARGEHYTFFGPTPSREARR
jgi:hypothetical protein